MDPTRPLSLDNPKFSTREYSSLKGIELNTLSLGFLYVLVAFGASVKILLGSLIILDKLSPMGLELNYGNISSDIRYISRAINKERTVKLKNGSLVYFAMNPLWLNDSKARLASQHKE